MYEDKRKKLKINWRSLILKMLILLIVIFLIIWIISLVTRKKEVPSNIGTNLKTMQKAALEYFTESKLPDTINGKKKITLDKMVSDKLIIEFKDQNGKACNGKESYAEATKINETDYTIKVKLVCNKDTDYVIDTIKLEKNETNNEGNTTNPNEGTSSETNQGQNTGTTKPSTGSTKPSTSSKPSTSKPSTTTKPSTSTKPSTETKPSTGTTVNTCSYGNKEYTANYPLAYIIEGNCAVSKTDTNSTYLNKVNSIGVNEYKKLYNEIIELENETNADLEVMQPSYIPVYNKSNTGLVGYQIVFEVKQNVTYSKKSIYKYYLDASGARTAIYDNRSSLQKVNNNNGVGVIKDITLNTYNLTLKVGESFNIKVTTDPYNVTTKAIFESSNLDVATVDNNGVIKALAKGTTYIIVTIQNVDAVITLEVQE